SVAAAITERAQLLLDEGSGDSRIFLEPFRNTGLERIENAATLTLDRSLGWRVQVLPDGSPTHVEPVLGPVQPVQVVDLIAGQHRQDSFIQQKRRTNQHVVVCKVPSPARSGVEVLQSPRLARE